MEGGIYLFWIILAIVVGFLGKDRKIGGGMAFLASIILSPIIGLIITLASDKVDPRTVISPQLNTLLNSAEKKYMEKDYEAAIQILQHALSLSPFSPYVHFYLAQVYSRIKRRAETFKHFTLAVEQGFTDFETLNTSSGFEFLRSLPEFRQYVQNGYKSVTLNTSDNDAVSKLERLASLKKEGLITDEEFELQKRKILAN